MAAAAAAKKKRPENKTSFKIIFIFGEANKYGLFGLPVSLSLYLSRACTRTLSLLELVLVGSDLHRILHSIRLVRRSRANLFRIIFLHIVVNFWIVFFFSTACD